MNIFLLLRAIINQLGRKKGRVEPHRSYPYFWGKQLVHRYLQNNICYFRSSISPWTGLHPMSLFWGFTSGRSKFSPCQKSASDEASFKLFLTFDVIFAKFSFWKIYEICWLQNMGHNGFTKFNISFFGV